MAFTDKPYSLDGSLNPDKVYQLDQMLEDLYRRLSKTEKTVQTAFPEGETVDVTRWKTGPWTFDGVWPSTPVARLSHNLAAATEYADYAPEGIDTAVELHVIPQGAGASISGIRHYARVSRKLCIANGSASETLTIPHEDTTSTDRFRFNLPNSEDIELGPYQVLWASYNPDLQRWQCMITPHAAGGLGQGSLQGGGGIVGWDTVRYVMSETDLEAVFGTPPTIVPAPGAGYGVYPVWAHFHMTVASGYGATPALRIQHVGLTTVHLTVTTTTWGAAGHKQATDGNANTNATASVDDLGLRLVFSADPGSGGSLTGNAVLTVGYVTLQL
jgi:hypothetical protein